MAAIIGGKIDVLDLEVAKFEQVPLTAPLVLNSIPKGGTHLIRNIMRMFAPVSQHYNVEFLQLPNLPLHGPQALSATRPMLSSAHLLYTDETVRAVANARHIVLVRDPHTWVLARARFYLSDEFHQSNLAHLKTGQVPALDLINMMIFGIFQKAPPLIDIYTNNAVAWMGTSATIVRYEDIVAALRDIDSKASERFFFRLFDDCGLPRIPDDWRERVLAGADPKQSRTARENLNISPAVVLPDVLPETQKKLIEFAAPGLRSLLGYA